MTSDTPAAQPRPFNVGLTFSHDLYDLGEAVFKTRAIQAFESFLAIADGVVRAQRRKIIFTTNLANIRDLDDALLRPGRCFAVAHMRLLGAEEAARLVERLCGGDAEWHSAARARLTEAAARSVSVAQVYRACVEAREDRRSGGPESPAPVCQGDYDRRCEPAMREGFSLVDPVSRAGSHADPSS